MRVPVAALLLALAACLLAGLPSSAGAHPPLTETERQVEQALEESPEDSDLQLQRAALYRQRSSWDEAAAAYLRAAALGADRDQVDVALAQVFLEAGLPLTAEMQVERVLARKPDDAAARITRARVRQALGNLPGAADDYQRGVELLAHPEPGVVREAMSAQVAAGRPEQALRLADAAMRKIGPVVSVQLPAIEIELESGHPEAALGRIDTLLAQAPRHEIWLAERGEILEKVGRVDEARATYEHSLSLIQERPQRRRSDKLTALEHRLGEKLAEDPKTEDNP